MKIGEAKRSIEVTIIKDIEKSDFYIMNRGSGKYKQLWYIGEFHCHENKKQDITMYPATSKNHFIAGGHLVRFELSNRYWRN